MGIGRLDTSRLMAGRAEDLGRESVRNVGNRLQEHEGAIRAVIKADRVIVGMPGFARKMMNSARGIRILFHQVIDISALCLFYICSAFHYADEASVEASSNKRVGLEGLYLPRHLGEKKIQRCTT